MVLSISIQYQLFKSPPINFNINIDIFAYQYFLTNALCTSGIHACFGPNFTVEFSNSFPWAGLLCCSVTTFCWVTNFLTTFYVKQVSVYKNQGYRLRKLGTLKKSAMRSLLVQSFIRLLRNNVEVRWSSILKVIQVETRSATG